MEGASIMGDPAERSLTAMQSGCDMVLMCNNRKAAIEVLDSLPMSEVPQALSLLKQQNFSLKELQSTERWQQANRMMNQYWDNKA